MSLPIESLTPRQIVAELDRYIVGQNDAKRAVAVALRNRWRRQQVREEDRDDILPKNILMMGPTGVGKTEIARRLAQLARAPFVKVEATKFTEVGYVGRDVESMVRELVAASVRLVESERTAKIGAEARDRAIDRVVEMLEDEGLPARYTESFTETIMRQAVEMIHGEPATVPVEEPNDAQEEAERVARRAEIRAKVAAGELNDALVEVETEEPNSPFVQVFSAQGLEEMGLDTVGGFGSRRVYRKVPVSEAIDLLEAEEAGRLIDKAGTHKEALKRAEQTGIIFIDELDKVAIKSEGAGPDVSREGVQRDLLPVIEGSTVPTKFGPVRTDHILFICAGAFHISSPSDLIPELQGRLPIRVNLQPLTEDDFRRILTEPRNSLTRQYELLLQAEGVTLTFEEDALEELARVATELNQKTQNIGARRLHTVLEALLQDALFDAPEIHEKVIVRRLDVKAKLETLLKNPQANRNIL